MNGRVNSFSLIHFFIKLHSLTDLIICFLNWLLLDHSLNSVEGNATIPSCISLQSQDLFSLLPARLNWSEMNVAAVEEI